MNFKKDDFLKHFSTGEKEQVTKLFEKVSLVLKTHRTTFFNEFLSPAVWSTIIEMKNYFGFDIYTYGGFHEAERKMVCFSYENSIEVNFPVKLVCIENRSKFLTLQHRDYLGALMALGIKRDKLGDLVVKDNRCFFPVSEELFEYIDSNLMKVGKCPCIVTEIEDESELPEAEYKQKLVIAAAMRLDAVVGAITGMSRSKSVNYIDTGKVQIDYIEVRDKSFEVNLLSTITVRGFGKYRIIETAGNSGSGKIKLKIYSFN
ncbi:RNA-binding protein [Clostridium oryzae]|uniref:RNA-binding S4 domain-containing protein n=1 Tax=Clostridium oryzae TaxID=1450648 RepID=A0A1V4ITU3_9CLOT|nr:YlmH/Sll1252 family protein [Clostridium oryzae]OPJ63230.1 hypothetical protein CLORY_13130 [Clostridium oryzae]